MHERSLLVVATLSLGLVGCDANGPAGTGRLTLQLAGGTTAAGAPAVTAGADVIVLTSVGIVARKIRLKRAEGECESDGESAANGGNDDDHDCPTVWLAPRVLSPPLELDPDAAFTVDLPEGSYNELKLQVHKPTGRAEDVALVSQYPEFEGISVRVTGTFNGTPFTFSSAVTAEIEVELDSPVIVSADDPVAITLRIDLATWFADSGGGLLSPLDPSQQVRSRIEQNIRKSFRVFHDDDRDGEPD